MSLHALLKDTWYMKLKAKREALNNVPSEFALRVPAMEKRNDNILKNQHQVVVPSNTLQTYKQTDGDYIRKHTNNNMEHKTSNFTPKLLALIKKSSPASDTVESDEPPVEDGIAEAEAEAEDAGSVASDIRDDLPILTTMSPEGKTNADKEVWQPVARAYTDLGLPIVLTAERQGANMNILGKQLGDFNAEDEDDADAVQPLINIVKKMTVLRNKLDGSFAKRVADDIKKIQKVIKRLNPDYKAPRVSKKKPLTVVQLSNLQDKEGEKMVDAKVGAGTVGLAGAGAGKGKGKKK
jgi:hypothetical protein